MQLKKETPWQISFQTVFKLAQTTAWNSDQTMWFSESWNKPCLRRRNSFDAAETAEEENMKDTGLPEGSKASPDTLYFFSFFFCTLKF